MFWVLLIITWSALKKNRYLDRAAFARLEVVQAGYGYLNPLLGSKQNSAIGVSALIPDFRHSPEPDAGAVRTDVGLHVPQ